MNALEKFYLEFNGEQVQKMISWMQSEMLEIMKNYTEPEIEAKVYENDERFKLCRSIGEIIESKYYI